MLRVALVRLASRLTIAGLLVGARGGRPAILILAPARGLITGSPTIVQDYKFKIEPRFLSLVDISDLKFVSPAI